MSPVVGHVTFTPTARGGVTPSTVFSCTVGLPYVVTTFSTGQITWTATNTCSIPLRMQGTTAFYVWGASNTYAWGGSYDNTSTSNTSSGQIYGIHTGTWGVNNNVLLFVPPGYTTSVGAGCALVATDQIKCTATTGPITAR